MWESHRKRERETKAITIWKRAVETERAVSVATGSLLSAISQYSELIWSLSHQCSILAAECIRTINTDYTNILSLYPPWHTILNISPDQLLISSGNWTILNSLATVSRRYRCSQTNLTLVTLWANSLSSILSDSISTFLLEHISK